MNIQNLKITLKTELKYFTIKTLFIILICLITPYIFTNLNFENTNLEINNFTLNIIYTFSFSICIFQLMLDSTTKDLLCKINLFFSNFNISLYYSLISKIIICIPISFLFFVCNILFYKIELLQSYNILLILLCFNICIYISIIVPYFFDSNSMLFSVYISMGVTIGLSIITIMLSYAITKIVISYILLIIILIIGIIILNRNIKSKRYIIKFL